MSNITIRGVDFDRNSFSGLRRGRFGDLEGRFGVYVFHNENYALYVGRCGDKITQDQDLCDRIQQYFTKNSSGVSFPKMWMERNNTQCYSHFFEFAYKLKLLALSTEEKSDHVIEIIKGIEEFLIRTFDPPYNFKYYDMLNSMEQKNIFNFIGI